MNKLISFIFSSLLATTVFATGKVTAFVCQTIKSIDPGAPTTKFEFAVTKLRKGQVAYSSNYDLDGHAISDDGMGDPVKMTPSDSALMLNENYGIRRLANGNLELSSDGAGCQLTKVVLYKESDYQAGYAAIKDLGCGATNAYTTIRCKVK